jgi:dihydropyrimidine dehydrogenase (NAD+) subunit PreA
MDKIDLSVASGGLTFKNPFIVASCPATRDADHILEAAKYGWGGAVTKTVTAHPPFTRNPTPSMASLKTKSGSVFAMSSNEIYTDVRLDQWCRIEIPKIKQEAPQDFILIGSVMEGPHPTHWAGTCLQLERAGVDMIEMNVSCPHGMSEKFMGKYIQDDPRLLKSVVQACKDAVTIPVTVKLNAHCINVEEIVRACTDGKADGFTATNTLASLISIDLETLRPVPASDGYSTFGGYCGPGLRPIALRFVAEIAQSTRLPISGVGGIENWKNVVEFCLVGASTIQIATGVMLQGYGMIEALTQNIYSYLERKGYTSFGQLRGQSLSYLVSSTEIERLLPGAIAVVNEQCTLCGKCVEPCKAGATNAITMTSDHLYINEETCIGCGLCVIVCPVDALHVG